MFKNAFAMLCAAALVVPAFAAEWMTNFDAAKAKAAAEDKVVLVDFTGSDWCHFCIMLRQQVLDTPEFDEFAKDKFVLMEVDMPNDKKKLQPGQLERNKELCARYNISGFPTLLVMTPEGDVLGGFVGGRQSFEEVQAPLEEAWANRQLLAEAKAATGLDKAKKYIELIERFPGKMSEYAEKYKQEILDSDPGNETGYHDTIQAERELEEVMGRLQSIGGDFKKGLGIVENALQKAHEKNKLALTLIKSQLMTMAAETEEDILQAKQTALDAAAMVPVEEEAAEIKAGVERQYANPAQLLQRVKAMRAMQGR